MSAWLVIIGGDGSDQYDATRPLPPIREEPLRPWLDAQPEYLAQFDVWDGQFLAGDIRRHHEDGVLRSVLWDDDTQAFVDPDLK